MGKGFNWGNWYTPSIRIGCHIMFWLLVATLYYYGYLRFGEKAVIFFTIKELIVTGSLYYATSALILILTKTSRTLKWKVFISFLFVFFAYFWWIVWTYIGCLLAFKIFPDVKGRLEDYITFITDGGFWNLFRLTTLGPLTLDFIFIVTVPLAPKLIKEFFANTLKLIQLERDNLAMELAFLKSQVSPHFLFNILNSIYRMSETNDPKTPDTVLQLSNLMRYVLYESKGDEILLHKEVDFIVSYLEYDTPSSLDNLFTKLRYNYDTFLTF